MDHSTLIEPWCQSKVLTLDWQCDAWLGHSEQARTQTAARTESYLPFITMLIKSSATKSNQVCPIDWLVDKRDLVTAMWLWMLGHVHLPVGVSTAVLTAPIVSANEFSYFLFEKTTVNIGNQSSGIVYTGRGSFNRDLGQWGRTAVWFYCVWWSSLSVLNQQQQCLRSKSNRRHSHLSSFCCVPSTHPSI